MAKIELNTLIDRPVEAVWKFMIDLSNLPKWSHGIAEKRQTSVGAFGVGATVLNRTRDGRTFSGRVAEFELNRKITWEFTSGPMKGTRESYNLETVGGKTRLSQAIDFKFSGFFKLLGPFLARGTRSRGEAHAKADLDNLKRMLESEATPMAATLHS
jgi:uncharacterized protein YndB with AHSA1/START domain